MVHCSISALFRSLSRDRMCFIADQRMKVKLQVHEHAKACSKAMKTQ